MTMVALYRKLAANRSLLKNLILSDLKHRYVGSLGGFLWSVIHPVVLLVSYTFIFGVVFRPEMGPESCIEVAPPHGLYRASKSKGSRCQTCLTALIDAKGAFPRAVKPALPVMSAQPPTAK